MNSCFKMIVGIVALAGASSWAEHGIQYKSLRKVDSNGLKIAMGNTYVYSMELVSIVPSTPADLKCVAPQKAILERFLSKPGVAERWKKAFKTGSEADILIMVSRGHLKSFTNDQSNLMFGEPSNTVDEFPVEIIVGEMFGLCITESEQNLEDFLKNREKYVADKARRDANVAARNAIEEQRRNEAFDKITGPQNHGDSPAADQDSLDHFYIPEAERILNK